MNDVVPAARKPNLFQPGKSGNPAGRPKGSRNAISLIKLQLEGELRARMRKDMPAVIDEMIRQALPKTVPVLDSKGNPKLDAAGAPLTETLPGDKDMLKTLFGAWVSKTQSSDEDAPKERIQIVIGKLDQIPAVNGKVFSQSTTEE